jgi:hypothetical protein
MLEELVLVCKKHLEMGKGVPEEIAPLNVAAMIKQRIEVLSLQEKFVSLEKDFLTEFKDVFEPLPHVDKLPRNVTARIKLKDAEQTIKTRTYACPRKFREAWQTLIQQHLDAGRIRPSSSPHASPAFIIPKADTSVLPRWVNDYRQLNRNTVTDSHPLPRIDDILNDCAKGKIWGTIDMTNSFFQTRMHPDDIPLTAVSTPFGLFEWMVMPMGLRNAPAIHQRRVSSALQPYIRKICHIYLDDIIIWSNTVEEHCENVRLILAALRGSQLYCNPKKTLLFQTEVDFLGHHISARGIEADTKKTDRIAKWPRPQNAKEVRQFCGLVRYIANFLPQIMEYTWVLTDLTTKECNANFPPWMEVHQRAFEAIKSAVVSRECLTTIDHKQMPEMKIFLTTDASDFQSGAVLSFGATWETACPVAFDSMTFKGAELNYPVHEKEMLAIIRALGKWRSDLIGVPVIIYTDHKTLENFDSQRDLSRRQARWMEFLSQYDCKIEYIKGDDNTVVDALSRTTFEDTGHTGNPERRGSSEDCRFPDHDEHDDALSCARVLSDPVTLLKAMPVVASTFSIDLDSELLSSIKTGYTEDPWCKRLLDAEYLPHGIHESENLLYAGDRLIVPRVSNVRELLFHLAHDVLGHFGFVKTYGSLQDSFYWPNM